MENATATLPKIIAEENGTEQPPQVHASAHTLFEIQKEEFIIAPSLNSVSQSSEANTRNPDQRDQFVQEPSTVQPSPQPPAPTPDVPQ